MAKQISAAEAKARLSELMTRVAEQGEHFLIERDGEPVAALVSVPELAQLEQTWQANPIEAAGESDWGGFQSLIGLWPEVTDAEIDAMVADIYAARERDLGRPVDLSDSVDLDD